MTSSSTTGPGRSAPARGVLIAGLACLTGVLVLAVAVHSLGGAPFAVDAAWHDLMVSVRTDAGLVAARVLAVIGGTLSMTVVGVVVVGYFVVRRKPWSAVVVAASMLLSEVVSSFLKVTVARPRPGDSLAETGMTSFPSGHTTLAAAFAVSLALTLRFVTAWVVAGVWVVAMAWSRTYLAVHWLSDTVAGALLGVATALLVWYAIGLARASGRASALRGATDTRSGRDHSVTKVHS